jgi:cyclohexanone monooxygenase
VFWAAPAGDVDGDGVPDLIVNIHGRGDETLTEHWAHGLRTLHGMLVDGFPNLFLLLPGTHSALAFNFPHIIDIQSQHAVRIIKRCKDDGISLFEIGKEDEDAWAAEIEAKSLSRLPTLQECTPSYYNGEGNLSDSLFNNIYGPGPFVYSDLMDRWFEERFPSA